MAVRKSSRSEKYPKCPVSAKQAENLEAMMLWLRDKCVSRVFRMECYSGLSHYKNISSTRRVKPTSSLKAVSRAICGSVGCIIGSIPRAIPEVFLEYVRQSGEQFEIDRWSQWDQLCLSVFGISDINPMTRQDNIAWHWMFSGGWSELDNTPVGASMRIYYFLTVGKPPEWFDSSSLMFSTYQDQSNPLNHSIVDLRNRYNQMLKSYKQGDLYNCIEDGVDFPVGQPEYRG